MAERQVVGQRDAAIPSGGGIAAHVIQGSLDGPLARRTLLVAAISLGLFAVLFVIWNGAGALFTILAGIVLAAALSAGTDALGRVLPLRRSWLLLILVAILFGLVGLLVAYAGAAIAEQVQGLTQGSEDVFAALRTRLENSAIAGALPEGYSVQQLLSGFFSTGGGGGLGLMDGATLLFGALSTAALIVFLGIFFAFNPQSYRAGVLSLLPHDKRPRVGEVLIRMGRTLRMWLLGQAISMLVVGGLTTVLLLLIGMPYAIVLGLQAGLLAFIPTLGPLIAAVPILIAGASVSPTMILYGLGVYVFVQAVESNLLMPLVPKRVVSLAPAFTLGSQLLLGALFGFAGLALAVPLMAMMRVAVEELYVEDDLGGAASGKEGERRAEEPA